MTKVHQLLEQAFLPDRNMARAQPNIKVKEFVRKCDMGVLFICKWAVHYLDFLGHHVKAEAIKLLSSGFEAIRVLAPPKYCKEVKAFLEIVQYYARFIPSLTNYTGTMHPLFLKYTKFE
ncbi:unnamed protein product [Lepeophtheirus salmonis]|uniref:(salmon louse) hypothetical protein n=1 Tax=Lepeophtheirus salmonis TaxID=72036 RepID=A0A7R8CNG4_LEPSM|nr:unnamed protein product [Lepeophtheirus salmonis]CAF2874985.1 unnamed protein product [Lepeophtheirus salmonis]